MYLLYIQDYGSPELAALVDILKAQRHAVPPFCGGSWVVWHEPGYCQVCGIAVDRIEKGLQCSNGGHRLCWPCMVKQVNWREIMDQRFRALSKNFENDNDELLRMHHLECAKINAENAKMT